MRQKRSKELLLEKKNRSSCISSIGYRSWSRSSRREAIGVVELQVHTITIVVEVVLVKEVVVVVVVEVVKVVRVVSVKECQ